MLVSAVQKLEFAVLSHSVVFGSLQPHGLQPIRLLHPWDFPGKSTGVGRHCLLHMGTIDRLQIDGETVANFILGGSKITADSDCSHEIKRRLLLGRKVMTNLDNILKSRDITLSTKVRLVKAMVFPVVIYVCEILTVKKAEH